MVVDELVHLVDEAVELPGELLVQVIELEHGLGLLLDLLDLLGGVVLLQNIVIDNFFVLLELHLVLFSAEFLLELLYPPFDTDSISCLLSFRGLQLQSVKHSEGSFLTHIHGQRVGQHHNNQGYNHTSPDNEDHIDDPAHQSPRVHISISHSRHGDDREPEDIDHILQVHGGRDPIDFVINDQLSA